MRLMEIEQRFQVWYRLPGDTGMAAHRLVVDARTTKEARRKAREQLDMMFFGADVSGWRITSVDQVE